MRGRALRTRRTQSEQRSDPARSLLLPRPARLIPSQKHQPANLKDKGFLERAMGFEPTTPTLARLCSTPELHPHP